MRILLINEYITGGGAEKIADLHCKILLECGHTVQRVYFGEKPEFQGETNIIADGAILKASRFLKTTIDPVFRQKLVDYVESFDPDLVIVHNVFSSPRSVYSALKGRRVILVAHDAFLICPTTECILRDGTCRLCGGYNRGKCQESCAGKLKDRVKMLLKINMHRKLVRQVRDEVSLIITPSESLGKMLSGYGLRCRVLNNPIQITVKRPVPKRNTGSILYSGGLCVRKGAQFLIDASELFPEGMKIDCFGFNEDTAIEENMKGNRFLLYRGYIQHENYTETLEKYDFIILPSLWPENYPTVALEAMLHGVVVIGADVGGIPEIIGNGRGILFQRGDRQSLRDALNKCIHMKDDQYNEIRFRAYEYVRSNNSEEEYKGKLQEMIARVCG